MHVGSGPRDTVSMKGLILVVFALLAIVECSPQATGWKRLAVPVKPQETVPITLVLNIQNEAHLDQLVNDVSDPQSPKYTNYITFQQMIDLYAPSQRSVNAVLLWLEQNGVHRNLVAITPTRDFLTFVVPFQTAEALFGVRYAYYSHPKMGSLLRSQEKPSVPRHLSNVIAIVSGVDNFPSGALIKSTSVPTASPQAAVTPQFIWNAFKTGTTSLLSFPIIRFSNFVIYNLLPFLVWSFCSLTL